MSGGPAPNTVALKPSVVPHSTALQALGLYVLLVTDQLKIPPMFPVFPGKTMCPFPSGPPSVWQAPGLGPAALTKWPSINASVTRQVFAPVCWTKNTRLNVSTAQSFPHVPESGDELL